MFSSGMERKSQRRRLAAAILTMALGAPIVYGARALPVDESARSTANTAIVGIAAPRADRDLTRLPDEAVMVLAGTMLIGIAAVVRRTTA